MKYQLQVTSTTNFPGVPRNASMAWFVRPCKEGVRTSNHEVCRKTSLGTGIADNHPYNRVFLDADVNEGKEEAE